MELTWKKEYWLVVVIIICLALFYYRDKLGNEKFNSYLNLIPVFAGSLYGLNTLINLVK